MLEIIRNKAEKLNNESNYKYQSIVDLLKDDKCFMKLDTNTSISILLSLGYNDIQAKKIYLELIKR
jgi:hypothetical protein